MIVTQKLVEEINGLVANESLILGIDKSMPALLGESAENVVVLSIEFDVVLVEVVEKVFRAKDFGDFDQLVTVAVPVEEWLLPKNHACKHSAQRPHVQAIVVLLKVDQQLGTLEVPASVKISDSAQSSLELANLRDSDVVLGPCMVKFRQTPVNQAQLSVLMIDHNVMRLDIPVHDAFAVTEVKGFEKLIDVISHVVVLKLGV